MFPLSMSKTECLADPFRKRSSETTNQNNMNNNNYGTVGIQQAKICL